MEDREIVLMFTSRDETALEHVAMIYGESLRRFASRILHSEQDAEECVNDTYQKAWESIPPAEPQNLAAYLFKICRHIAFGMLDRQHTAKRSAQLVELTDELASCLPTMTIEDALNEEELERILQCFLETLPKDSRMIFMRRYWFGDSIKEIASRYRISESKVKTSLHRTRNKLREALEREGLL